MKEEKRSLLLLPQTYAVCRLEKNAPSPKWGTLGHFFSLTRTDEELSVVCPKALVPREVKREGGWRVLKVKGPLDFSSTGVLASLTAPLARKRISIFALSTYDTDYLLVKEEKLEKAIQALREEGYKIEGVGAGFKPAHKEQGRPVDKTRLRAGRPYGVRSKRKNLRAKARS